MNKSGLNKIERKTAAEGPWAARDEHEKETCVLVVSSPMGNGKRRAGCQHVLTHMIVPHLASSLVPLA